MIKRYKNVLLLNQIKVYINNNISNNLTKVKMLIEWAFYKIFKLKIISEK